MYVSLFGVSFLGECTVHICGLFWQCERYDCRRRGRAGEAALAFCLFTFLELCTRMYTSFFCFFYWNRVLAYILFSFFLNFVLSAARPRFLCWHPIVSASPPPPLYRCTYMCLFHRKEATYKRPIHTWKEALYYIKATHTYEKMSSPCLAV